MKKQENKVRTSESKSFSAKQNITTGGVFCQLYTEKKRRVCKFSRKSLSAFHKGLQRLQKQRVGNRLGDVDWHQQFSLTHTLTAWLLWADYCPFPLCFSRNVSFIHNRGLWHWKPVTLPGDTLGMRKPESSPTKGGTTLITNKPASPRDFSQEPVCHRISLENKDPPISRRRPPINPTLFYFCYFPIVSIVTKCARGKRWNTSKRTHVSSRSCWFRFSNITWTDSRDVVSCR